MDGSSVQSGANLTVFDQYSNTTNLHDMSEDQILKWTTYGGLGNQYLFLLSWTLTPDPNPLHGKFLPVWVVASRANAALPGVLFEKIIGTPESTKLPNPNIVYIDFLGPDLARSIILYNFADT
jgi:1-phosphatidylinositol phosphodiesterase